MPCRRAIIAAVSSSVCLDSAYGSSTWPGSPRRREVRRVQVRGGAPRQPVDPCCWRSRRAAPRPPGLLQHGERGQRVAAEDLDRRCRGSAAGMAARWMTPSAPSRAARTATGSAGVAHHHPVGPPGRPGPPGPAPSPRCRAVDSTSRTARPIRPAATGHRARVTSCARRPAPRRRAPRAPRWSPSTTTRTASATHAASSTCTARRRRLPVDAGDLAPGAVRPAPRRGSRAPASASPRTGCGGGAG